jgi:glucosamine-6-phosphate deaminase
MIKVFQQDKTQIKIYDHEIEMANTAGNFVAQHLHNSIREKGKANLIVGTGTSQIRFLEALSKRSLDWEKITVFHLDEYIGISPNHPASFRKYLRDRFINIVQPGKAYFLNGDADDLQAEIERYQKLLKGNPIDIACIGIGENGHIAFNDPPTADFDDPKCIKVVVLDEACRMQQVGEGWFDKMEDVPTRALTLTIPTILESNAICCVVPDQRKAEAVQKTLYGPISTECPASILRNHPNAILFLDKYSSCKLQNESSE